MRVTSSVLTFIFLTIPLVHRGAFAGSCPTFTKALELALESREVDELQRWPGLQLNGTVEEVASRVERLYMERYHSGMRLSTVRRFQNPAGLLSRIARYNRDVANSAQGGKRPLSVNWTTLFDIAHGNSRDFFAGNTDSLIYAMRREAAVLIARGLGDVPSDVRYPRDRLMFEAGLINATLESFPVVYRMERRSPDQIVAAQGFFPNVNADPARLGFTYWEHTTVQSSAFVSTTLNIDNPILFNIVRPGLDNEYFKYEIHNVEGIRTPSWVFDEEVHKIAEVTTTHVPLENISRWRRIRINPRTYQVLEETPWTSMRAPFAGVR